MTELLTCGLLSRNRVAGLFSKHRVNGDRVFRIGQQAAQFDIGVGLSNFHLKRTHVIRLCADVYYSCRSAWSWRKVRPHRIRRSPHRPFTKQASVLICSLSHHFLLGTDATEPYKTEHHHACCFRITLYIWTSGHCCENNSAGYLDPRRVWEELNQECSLERV